MTSPSPIFVSAATAAARCEISEDTWRAWVERGIVPPATVRAGQIVRWYWPAVEAVLAGAPKTELDDDPSVRGVIHAKDKNRAHS
jgi:hypothetical protein